MRKYFISILAVFILLLTACDGGEETTSEVSGETDVQEETTETNSDEFISEEVSFGETFLAVYKKFNETQEFNLTIDNYQITENKHPNESHNENYDYVEIHVVLENIGDIPVDSDAFSDWSFSFYNENGVEIGRGPMAGYDNETFKEAEVRPGGKNEGIFYLSISKGEVPAQMIYSPGNVTSTKSEYIFNIQ